ncbi:HPP family protein [Rhodopseudomonas palustris]
MTGTERLASALRHLGPAVGFHGWPEAARAGLGMALALLAVAFVLPPGAGVAMIAPFGATAFLLIALPNSPLAQPWSAFVGNGLSATVAVAVVLTMDDPVLRVVLATGLAMLAMHLARALHPPGGAVALMVALSPDLIARLGFGFVLVPVLAGTAALIAVAAVYARATGRRYPFRQPAEMNTQGTSDPPPTDRLGVSRDELAALLLEFRQSANIGVEDLARLIGAAETLAARHHTDGLRCDEVMSRDLVTVGPEAPLDRLAAIFRSHGFTSVPVVGPDHEFLGVVFQIHLIRHGLDPRLRADAVMTRHPPHLPPGAPVSAALPLLAETACDAVPVLEGRRIVGLLTRTDLIAALARMQPQGANPPHPPAAELHLGAGAAI